MMHAYGEVRFGFPEMNRGSAENKHLRRTQLGEKEAEEEGKSIQGSK